MSSNIYIYTRICVIKTLASTHASRTFWIFSSTSLLLHDSFNDSLFMQIVWSGGEGKSWSKGRKGEIDVTRIEDLSLSTRGIIRDFIIRYFSLVIFLIADDSLVVQFFSMKTIRTRIELVVKIRYVKIQEKGCGSNCSNSPLVSRVYNRMWKSRVLSETVVRNPREGQGSRGRERGEKSRPIDGTLNLFSAINRIAGKWICNDIYRNEADRGELTVEGVKRNEKRERKRNS